MCVRGRECITPAASKSTLGVVILQELQYSSAMVFLVAVAVVLVAAIVERYTEIQGKGYVYMNIYKDGEERERKSQAVYHVLLLLYFVRPFLALYVYKYMCVCMFIGDYTAPLLHNSSSSTYSIPKLLVAHTLQYYYRP